MNIISDEMLLDFKRASQSELASILAKKQHLADVKNNFITSVSHEFRTPMAVIQTSIVLVRHYQSAGQCEKVNQHLVAIEQSLTQLNCLIDEIASLKYIDEDLPYDELENLDIPALAVKLKEAK